MPCKHTLRHDTLPGAKAYLRRPTWDPPAPGLLAGGWVGQRTLMGALQAPYIGPTGTFPCHTEHPLGCSGQFLVDLWRRASPQASPMALLTPGAFPKHSPSRWMQPALQGRTSSRHTVSTAGKLGPQTPTQPPQSQPGPQECLYLPFPEVLNSPSSISHWTHAASCCSVQQPTENLLHVSDFLHFS